MKKPVKRPLRDVAPTKRDYLIVTLAALALVMAVLLVNYYHG